MTINEALMYGLVSNLDMLSLPENKFHKVYMAKEILRNAAEKQIPKEAALDEYDGHKVCPVCGCEAFIIGDFGTQIDIEFCYGCGQKIIKGDGNDK